MDEFDLVSAFVEARSYICNSVSSKVECFLTDMWDPMIKFMIIKETNEIINRELSRIFPELDPKYYPKIKFKVDEDEKCLEIGIQNYLNKDRELIFLGTCDYGNVLYDFYVRDSWDPSVSHVFYARYGHEIISYEKGSKKPAAEYMMGIMTPLSIAYSFAIEEGFVS